MTERPMQIKIDEHWIADRTEMLSELRIFAAIMRRAPFANRAGLRGVSAFALFWFLRRIKPDVVFEVGVWRGFSTWLIEQALPGVELHCFDPILMLEGYLNRWKVGRVYRSSSAVYSTQDFSCAPITDLIAGRTRPLAFFDDHQNKLPRLHQCRTAGIRDIVFDDNMPEPGSHRSLEADRLDPARRHLLVAEIESYEVFPALWPVDIALPGLAIKHPGLDFPREPAFEPVYRERNWHSSVTHVRLRAERSDRNSG